MAAARGRPSRPPAGLTPMLRLAGLIRAASGVFSVGFTTMRLLVATAGATLWITWLSGWLNGVMAEIAPSSSMRCTLGRWRRMSSVPM